MDLNTLYFYTSTINGWKPILTDDIKRIIINSLTYLVRIKKIKVYGFVIMPNHIHLIWEFLEPNGKELPHASFKKFTAHQIQQILRERNPSLFESFKVNDESRRYLIWQKDAHFLELYSSKVIFQKLDYIHNNPCQGKWMLAENPVDYKYSSFSYYDNGDKRYDFLTHIQDRIQFC